MTVLAVVGGQYGSEGKGAIINYLAEEFDWHVRSGGPNAGHTFNRDGRKWPMQQVPCGWTNPKARLILTAGALVSLEVLERELQAIAEYQGTDDIYDRLYLDEKAGIISEAAREEAGGVQGEAHRRYGSTGEGVGVARIARLRRDPAIFQRAEDAARERPWLYRLLRANTAGILTEAARNNERILLEGTQGTGLSVIHGTWPYTTNHDTNAAQLLADAGLAPQLCDAVIVVFRTWPIRVAGNSGPLQGETTWEEMAKQVGQEGLIEYTTVTKKPRRIGTWDWQLAQQAVQINQPHGLFLSFADYLAPQCQGVTDWNRLNEVAPEVSRFVGELELRLGTRVWFVGTGPDQIIDRRSTMNRHWSGEWWNKAMTRRGTPASSQVGVDGRRRP